MGEAAAEEVRLTTGSKFIEVWEVKSFFLFVVCIFFSGYFQIKVILHFIILIYKLITIIFLILA